MAEADTPGGVAYATHVVGRIGAGRVHASLGPNLKDGSASGARKMFDRLLARGVQPSDFVVDLGCGTLRVGTLLIDYLNPRRYFGLDLDHRLLDIGREMLPVGVVEAKEPTLRVISPEAIDAIASLEPHWVFSKGVIQHVSPAGLGPFFQNIARLAAPRTTVVLQVSKLGDTTRRLGVHTWSHALADLEAEAKRAGLQVRENPDPRSRSAKLLILGHAASWQALAPGGCP